MIKLAFLVASEKIIIGQDNNTSLISVLEHIQLNAPIPGEIPDNAAVPFKWSAIALWHRTEEIAEPITYDTRFELANPVGDVYMGGDANFVVSNNHVNFRNVVDFPLFPMKLPGTY